MLSMKHTFWCEHWGLYRTKDYTNNPVHSTVLRTCTLIPSTRVHRTVRFIVFRVLEYSTVLCTGFFQNDCIPHSMFDSTCQKLLTIASGYELVNRHLRQTGETHQSTSSQLQIQVAQNNLLVAFMMKSILSFLLLALAIASTSAFGVYTPVVSQSSSVSVGMIDWGVQNLDGLGVPAVVRQFARLGNSTWFSIS